MIGVSLIGMSLIFNKMHPGSISDFDIIEKKSMLLAGFTKTKIKGLSSKIFLVSKMFLKKAISKKQSSFQKPK